MFKALKFVIFYSTHVLRWNVLMTLNQSQYFCIDAFEYNYIFIGKEAWFFRLTLLNDNYDMNKKWGKPTVM